MSGDTGGLAVEERDRPAGALPLLDRAAELSVADCCFAARRDLYEGSDGLQVPAVIQHFDYLVANAWRDVDWQNEP